MKKFKNSEYGFAGLRIDKFLASVFSDFSRSFLQKLIKNGNVLVNGKTKKTSYSLLDSDVIEVADFGLPEIILKSQDLDIEIVYEDDSVFVVNKPAGMVVHPTDSGCHIVGTVANFAKSRVEEGVGDSLRPGIVHRIDKDTSGLLVVAKTQEAYEKMVQQFKDRKVKKKYFALVLGCPTHKHGIVDSPIGRAVTDRQKMRITDIANGREAISEYEVIEEFHEVYQYSVSLLDIEIKTGRTHQIRVHMSALAYPVVGDHLYGNDRANKLFKSKLELSRQFLHAAYIGFTSPSTGKFIEIKSKLPSDLEGVLSKLRE